MNSEPTVRRQIADRTAQREKLRAYFVAHPETFWTQETLAEMCGSDIGAVRTRISELRSEGFNLVAQKASYLGEDGHLHRGKKMWMYQPRPEAPLGPDAAEPRADGLLFAMSPRG